MPHLLQQLLAPLDPFARTAPQPPAALHDEDIALGCECANPALQFEGWEPLPPPGAALHLSSNL